MKTQYKNIVSILFIFCFVSMLQAEEYEKARLATNTESAIKLLFGNRKIMDTQEIRIKAPALAENGGSVPIGIKTNIRASRVALFCDANPRALVIVWKVHRTSILDYKTKIKMRKTANVTVVVEGIDGNLYRKVQKVEVSIGGCGGGGGGGGGGSYIPPSNVRTQAYIPKPRVYRAPQRVQNVQKTQNYPRVNTNNSVYSDGRYRYTNENSFKDVSHSPLSTFSTDVDTASYSVLRSSLNTNRLPSRELVRTEEMINYFNYDYKEPRGREPFYINTQVGDSIWNRDSKVVQIGLQSRNVETSNLPANNLVFLLDVSGSMNAENKLPLLVNSLKLLVKNLRAIDRISIVVYAGSSGIVLDRARGDEKEKIIRVLDSLRASGGTAGGQGIQLAYDLAQQEFRRYANNRIILASDGDFNIGISNERDLLELIERKRETGIYLSVLGFGSGNYRDSKMELLADKGNGNYYYIDTILEAKKVLVTQMNSTLHTIAKDVKIQVEFNPAMVHSYRLIGYENRLLANRDFNDDTKDAGEVGMGHKLTVLYEIIPTSYSSQRGVDNLKYQRGEYINSNELMNVKIRYKYPKENTSQLISKVINQNDNEISRKDFIFAQSVAGFAMKLKASPYTKNLNYRDLIEHAKNSKGYDRDGNRAEFIKMVEKADLFSR